MRSTLPLLVFALLLSVSCNDHSLAISAETQKAMDIEAIDKYLADNGIIAQVHPSGLRYVITQQGTGEKPTAEKCVRVNYKLRFLGETDVFDQLDGFGTPLIQTIVGWRIGLKELQKGGSMTLYVPSGLAYGPGGNRAGADKVIPPNQNLVFDVELLNLTTFNSAGVYCNPWP